MEYKFVNCIELKLIDKEKIKLTVTGHHAVELLTLLKEKNIEASGQDTPLFGYDNFPTIYYIIYSVPFENLHKGVKEYLDAKSLKYREVMNDGSDILKFEFI